MTRQVTFGNREWIRGILQNYAGHLARVKNMPASRKEQTDALLDEAGSGMANWSKSHREILADSANAADLTAIVEFLYAQAARPDALPAGSPPVVRGREIFETGELTKGKFEVACADCHTLHVRGEAETAFEGGLPDLTNYGGVDWNRRFLTSPEEIYGDNNAMPAFGEQLSAHELEMLSHWLAGEFE